MKKVIFPMIMAGIMVSLVFMSFGQEANKKAIKARVNLQDDQTDTTTHTMEMMKVHLDFISEFQYFKKKAELKFANNEKCIADFKENQTKLKKMDDACKEKISKLEQRNNKLKNMLTNYKDAGAYEWKSFKNLFNYDMEELEVALEELAPFEEK
ncbi:hypothetical protein ACRTDU_09415 [Sunxiuqinia elliptica]